MTPSAARVHYQVHGTEGPRVILLMGLGASFLTLVVAESVGVKSGLGWYVSWAQGWAEYGKVFAALIIMAAFFSTIMTLLFKIRDRVLVWQKGVIKW